MTFSYLYVLQLPPKRIFKVCSIFGRRRVFLKILEQIMKTWAFILALKAESGRQIVPLKLAMLYLLGNPFISIQR